MRRVDRSGARAALPPSTRRPGAGRHPARRATALAAALATLLLGACGSRTPTVPDNEPTLASLQGRTPAGLDSTAAGVKPGTPPPPPAPPARAIAAWNQFLASPALPRGAPERVEAERRLADLEMDRADQASAESGQAPDWGPAIARYQAFLRSHPQAPQQDGVLYQLARAHDLNAQPAQALATLDRLVAEHPGTPMRAEAEFRRGELLFSAGRHADAERAFSVVLQARPESLFHERSLYMQGWSRFKLARLEDGLQSFFGVLDRKLGGPDAAAVPALSRADKELVEDSFRVIGLSLQSLQGADSIPPLMSGPAATQRAAYEPLVYRELAELYLKQERVKDAADTLAAFAARRPLHAQAPVLLSRVIAIHEQAGFGTLALQAKEDFVRRYGVQSAFRSANAEGWERVQPLVKTHLTALARHHHARAQQTRSAADIGTAIGWYREMLVSFPQAPEAAESRFLLAELLFENQRWAEALSEYEQVAYGPADATSAGTGDATATPPSSPTATSAPAPNPRAAEAGYAVLLAHARLAPVPGSGTASGGTPDHAQTAWRRQGIERGLRFVDAFGADPRAAAVLTDATDQRFALGDAEGATALARRLLAWKPEAGPAQRRVAWTVLAHTAFDAARYAESEAAYREVQALAPGQAAIDERLAASIYRQGEAERQAGRLQAALGHFDRVPAGAARATAEIDAAAARVSLGDWAGAASALEAFRRQYPTHPLAADVPARLAAAYLELKDWTRAADELDRVADRLSTPTPVAGLDAAQQAAAARDARWQSADLRARTDDRRAEKRALERYLALHPSPLAPAVEARHRLATMAAAAGDRRMELAWTRALVDADRTGGAERTARTQTLAAMAQLGLTTPQLDAYRQIALKEPLQRSLKLKKTRLEEALAALQQVAEYGVPEAVSAATFHSAELYREFGRALMASERPKGLKKAEREQYDVLLEEQAFPFEEKAIALHEGNARRVAPLAARLAALPVPGAKAPAATSTATATATTTATPNPAPAPATTPGLAQHDDWTLRSLQALGQMVPARWAALAQQASTEKKP